MKDQSMSPAKMKKILSVLNLTKFSEVCGIPYQTLHSLVKGDTGAMNVYNHARTEEAIKDIIQFITEDENK